MKRNQPAITTAVEEDFEQKHPAWFFALILVGGAATLLSSLLFLRFAVGPSINQRGHEISHSIAATQEFTAKNNHLVY